MFGDHTKTTSRRPRAYSRPAHSIAFINPYFLPRIYKDIALSSVVLQPIVNQEGQLQYHEVLSRFKSASGTPVNTGAFIAELENQPGWRGIRSLDVNMLGRVVRVLQRNEHISLSWNLSPRSIATSDGQNTLLRWFRRIPPAIARRISVELLESAELPDMSQAKRILQPLRDKGAKAGPDDVGTGFHTDMSRLAVLEPDYVKIDRSIAEAFAATVQSGRMQEVRSSQFAQLIGAAKKIPSVKNVVIEGMDGSLMKPQVVRAMIDMGQGLDGGVNFQGFGVRIGRPLLLAAATPS
jgi:EAL domain-containing protein (putative c-di-GMP-specific phosphodiesterase class I)